MPCTSQFSGTPRFSLSWYVRLSTLFLVCCAALSAAEGKWTPDQMRLAMMNVDIDGLYRHTRVTDLAERLKMFDETAAQLRARHDPAIDLAFELEKARGEMKQREDTRNGAISRLRPVWMMAVIAQAG